MTGTVSEIRRRRVALFMVVFFSVPCWVSPVAAQVLSLDVKPASDKPPAIEVLNDGKSYTRMAAESIELPVEVSARCVAGNTLGSYYLITNSSETDFLNRQITGTVGLGELGYMPIFRPRISSAELAAQKQIFKVPLHELYAGDDPLPVQICNTLLARKVKGGVANSAVLAKDWKVIQPLAISFMPGCARGNTTYWSKLSATQIVNYVCKASQVAVAAEANRVADERKRKAADAAAKREAEKKKAELEAQKRAAAAREAAKKKAELEAEKQAAAKREAERKARAAQQAEREKQQVAATGLEVAARPRSASKMVAKLSITAVPQEYSGECPALIAFKGKITAAQKGPIRFYFQDGDQAEATRAMVFKNKDDTQSFQTQTLFEASKAGSMKLIVEGPQKEEAATSYSVVCKN